MLTAAGAELHLLKTLGSRLFIPGGVVVAPLALTACQYRDITHFESSFVFLSSFQEPIRRLKATHALAGGRARSQKTFIFT